MGFCVYKRGMSTHLRRADLQDLDTLIALEQASFNSDQLSSRQMRYWLTARTGQLWVAEGAGGVQGYALVRFRKGSSMARLYSIAVATPGQGVASTLIGGVERCAIATGCDRIQLEVSAGNHRAIALYERLGYRQRGRRVGYYANGDDALVMCRDLGGRAPQGDSQIPP